MVEPIMFVGIGFLVAGLLVIGVIPLVHARAVRLTMRRLEALTPVSMAEIQADKDQLRAEFAMSTRRLEISVEQMKAKTTNQLADIGKKSDAIGRLKIELGDKNAALLALEAKDRQVTEELEVVREELAGKLRTLGDMDRAFAETQSELSQISGSFHESSVAADSQRVELVAARAQGEVLKGQIANFERETKDLRDRLGNKSGEVEMMIRQLAEERAKSEQLGNRVSELDRQIVAQTTEHELLGRRVQEMTTRLDEQGRFLADREFVSDRLRNDAVTAQKTEAEIRAEFAETESRHQLATEAVRAEKSLVEEQLRQSQEERAKLQREIAAMKRDAESAWTNERMENAVLRERINDVAAEVARLTATLEGEQSPIETILKSDHAQSDHVPAADAVNAASPTLAPQNGEARGTLADRIRALQSRASRVPQPSGA
jgi:chromosome segregation ATPase